MPDRTSNRHQPEKLPTPASLDPLLSSSPWPTPARHRRHTPIDHESPAHGSIAPMHHADLIDRARSAVHRPRRTPRHEPHGAPRRAPQPHHLGRSATSLLGCRRLPASATSCITFIQKPLARHRPQDDHDPPHRRPQPRHQDRLRLRRHLRQPLHPLPALALHLAGHVRARKALRLPLHGRDRRPVPLRRLVRLPLRVARRHEGASSTDFGKDFNPT